MENNETDLKKREEELLRTQSDPDQKSQTEKELEEKADRLLKDGTPANKEIKVSKKTYDDKSDKAKLYEAHAPLLDKVLENPELVESLLETKEKGNLDERLSRIEEERKADKRREIREAVKDALSVWPDFEKMWPEVQPITDALAKQGVPYGDALRRGYLAMNPEAAAQEKERIAREGENARGTFSTFASHTVKPFSIKDKPKISEIEMRVGQALGKTPEEYAGLLEKHKDWIKTHGFEDTGE